MKRAILSAVMLLCAASAFAQDYREYREHVNMHPRLFP